jgi:tRNA uridine 5-carbamoylmethylation protein Kti12
VKELDEREIWYIWCYRSNDRAFGYNIESGGNGKGKTSDETRKRLSESHMGQIAWNKGKKMSEEQKLKLSNAKKGKKLSEIHRQRISDSLKIYHIQTGGRYKKI